MDFDNKLTTRWKEFQYWYGNPSLNYKCFGKRYPRGQHMVYIFGLPYDELNPMSGFRYTVRFSFSGMFKVDSSVDELQKYLDFRSSLNLIDHGRSLTDIELYLFNKSLIKTISACSLS